MIKTTWVQPEKGIEKELITMLKDAELKCQEATSEIEQLRTMVSKLRVQVSKQSIRADQWRYKFERLKNERI